MDPALLSAAALALLGAALRVPRDDSEYLPRTLLLGLWAGLALAAAAVFVGGGGLPGQVALLGFGFLAASGRGVGSLRLSGTSATALGAVLLAASAMSRSPLAAPVAIGPPMLAVLALVASGVALNLLARWFLHAATPARARVTAGLLLGASAVGVLLLAPAEGRASGLTLVAPLAALGVGLIDFARLEPQPARPGDERVAATAAAIGLAVAGAAWALYFELLAAVPGRGPAPLFALAAAVVFAVANGVRGPARGLAAAALLIAAALVASGWGAFPA